MHICCFYGLQCANLRSLVSFLLAYECKPARVEKMVWISFVLPARRVRPWRRVCLPWSLSVSRLFFFFFLASVWQHTLIRFLIIQLRQPPPPLSRAAPYPSAKKKAVITSECGLRAKWAERFLCLFWNNAQICLLISFRFVVSLLFCSSHFFLSHPEGALARLSAHQKVYCWLHLFLPSLSILITKRSLSEVISL